ncbi:uncharacterized protein BDV14DRAFT_174619 [Aspergillus stella-maris]|uniref:uncharacterized protein n=1 Tax=Aspergillus stella-maris TaxID=1810926 RepID=UPI003CCCB139
MEGQRSNTQQNSGQSSQTNGTSQNHNQAGYQEQLEADLELAEYYQTFLSRFLTVVSLGEPDAVNRLISIIRSGVSETEIFAALAELRADIEPAEVDDSTQQS